MSGLILMVAICVLSILAVSDRVTVLEFEYRLIVMWLRLGRVCRVLTVVAMISLALGWGMKILGFMIRLS